MAYEILDGRRNAWPAVNGDYRRPPQQFERIGGGDQCPAGPQTKGLRPGLADAN
ncbi:hypothetical protein D3C76_1521240 [compost metagenome]